MFGTVRVRGAVRLTIIVIIAALAIWFSIAVAASGIGRTFPAAARLSRPFDAEVKLTAAARTALSDPNPANIARAARLAEDVLRRNPLSVDAATTLALSAAAAGNQDKARRLFAYSESLSRRDFPTQLWLIEERVAANDIAGALLHYDRALRTSNNVGEMLFPVLVGASNDPQIAEPLSAMLAARPAWWPGFTWQLIAHGQSADAIFRIGRALRLDPDVERERTVLTALLRRLVADRRFGQAHRLFLEATGQRRETAGGIRNGDFEANNALPPFHWQLANESDLAAVIQEDGEHRGGRALYLIATNGRGGEVARQLLVLGPGSYRLSAVIGGSASHTRPQVSLACANAPSVALVREQLPPTGQAGATWSVSFSVTANGCPAQWLIISLDSDLDGEGSRPWIDSIAVERI